MKNTFMIAASTLALAVSMPAMAENAGMRNNTDTPAVQTTTGAEIEAGWENTKEAVSNAADDVSNAAQDAYAETKAWFDTDTDIDTYVEANNRLTSERLIGKDLVDSNGDKVAQIDDLVIDGNGTLNGAILSYGGVAGIGAREVMADYASLGRINADGRVSTNLTTASLDGYPNFDKDNMNAGLFLASDLAQSDIVSPDREEIAEVENIVIENGLATKLVVSYLDGVVPEKAMIDFTDAEIVMDEDNEATFELSMNEASQLKAFINK